MSPIKQAALKAIRALPDDATIEDIIERLHFIAQVEAGLRDLDEGRFITHEEMKKRIRECRSK